MVRVSFCGVALGIALTGCAPAWATPYIPTNDAVVLQFVLPSADPRLRTIRDLSVSLAHNPQDDAVRIDLAAHQLSLGVAESDPHFVGYAQATLSPWWQSPKPPVKVRVLRARIHQAQHDIVPARQELEAIVAEDPSQFDAWLVLAGIDETAGDLTAAAKACHEVERRHPGLAATACAASVDSVSGHAQQALVSLTSATEQMGASEPALLGFALTILAEIHARLDNPEADQTFHNALATSPSNLRTLISYADYLLEKHRAPEVTRLLAGRERIDALLLRLAIAAHDQGSATEALYVAELASRYETVRVRGDVLHPGNESRFELELRGNPARALELARQNWTQQRTPLDARIYLAAALAAHDQPGIDTISAWAEATRIEDRQLQRMLQQKKNAP